MIQVPEQTTRPRCLSTFMEFLRRDIVIDPNAPPERKVWALQRWVRNTERPKYPHTIASIFEFLEQAVVRAMLSPLLEGV